MSFLTVGLYITGIFSLILGILHFFFPLMLDFRNAIPKTGDPIKPFRLGFIRYGTQRSDVYGIAWVMNYATSYVLVTIGLFDLFSTAWVHTTWGDLLTIWIAGWFLRAGAQLYLGRRRGDWLILDGFAMLGIIQRAPLW